MKNSIILAFLILSVSSTTTVHAANFTWTGNSSSTWSGSSNWVEGSAPGNSTTTDTAIFNQASYANQPDYGTTSIAGIAVGGQSGDFAGALTLNGTALTVGSGGITLNPGAVNAVTLNGSILLDGNQTWSKFSNAGAFRINANITNNSSTTPVELTFNASQREGSPFTNRILLLGSISDNGNGTVSLRKTGLGVLSLEGSQSTFTGGIVNEAGTIQLNYNANSSLKLPGTGGLVLRGGGFHITGGNITQMEEVASTTLEAGGSPLSLNNTSTSMHLGNLTRTGGSVRFSDQTTGNFLTNTANTNGILGAWATFNGLDWATNSANGANGTIAAYTDYTNIDALGSIISDNSTANVRISANGSSGNIALGNDTTTINTLLQSNNATAATVDFVGKTLRTSGIMVASGAASLSIGTDPGAGTLTAKEGDSELHLVNFSANNTLTINSVIADNGNATRLTKFGSGTVVLSAVNTYTGPTAVNLGTLQFSFADSLYSGNETKWTAENINVSLQSTLAFNVGGSSEFNNSHIGTLLSNLATSNSTTSGMREGSSLGFDTTNAADGNFTLDQVISDTDGQYGGSRGLVKLGNGTLTLSANNTYTFTTSVLAGTLATSQAERISDSSAVSVAAGATFQLGGNETVGSISGAGNYSIAGFTLTAGGDNTRQTVSGSISGAGGSLTKTGFELLILSGNNTYTGATTINAGTLQIGEGGTTGSISSSSAITNNGTLAINRSNGNITLSNTISGSGNLTKSGAGTLTLSGSNAYTGTTRVSAGVLNIQHANALGSTSGNTTVSSGAALQLQGNITVGTEALSLNGTGVSATGALRNISGSNTYGGAITLAGNTTIGSDAGTLTLSSGSSITGTDTNLTFVGAGRITINDAIATGSGTLTKNGTGTVTLSGNNTYTGATTINAGNLTISNNTALGTTAQGTTVASGAALQLQGNITVGAEALSLNGTGVSATGALRNISGSNTYGGAITLAGNTTIGSDAGTLTLSSGSSITGTDTNLTFVGAGHITINDAIATGSGTLTKNGTGTVTLSGNNTYTGNTTVNAGTLVFQKTAAKSANSNVTVAAAGTVGLGVGGGGGTDYSAADVANLFNSNSTLNGFTLNASSGVAIDTTAGNFTQSSTLNGTRALTKLGNNTLTLSGNNTYTGSTTVGTSGGANAGTLQLSGLGKISNAAVNIFGGTLDLNGSNQSITTLTMGGGASGSTAAVTTGNGTLRLGGNVVFSATNNASGASISGKLDLGNATRTFTIGDSSVATSDLTIDAAISNGGLTKNGTGTLTLSGNNTYTGNTTVNAGTLTASAANALGGTTSINVNGGSLLLTAGNAVNDTANINLGGGTLAVNGNFNENVGVLSLSANSTLDLNGFTGILRFGGVGSWASTTALSIWNWNSTTQNIVFSDNTNLSSYLSRISFYSNSGVLIGTATTQSYTGLGGGTEIIAVPEPETYIIVMVFLLGFGIYQLRLARKGQGRLARLTFLRQKRS
jgi:autotransporter-associated beta strand protein